MDDQVARETSHVSRNRAYQKASINAMLNAVDLRTRSGMVDEDLSEQRGRNTRPLLLCLFATQTQCCILIPSIPCTGDENDVNSD
jgi:hypothetical protein